MRGITPPGLTGTGLDVDGLVTKLVSADRAPVENRLNRQEVQIQTNISALGIFRGALANFQDSVKGLRSDVDLHKVSAKSSNDESVAVSASSTAQEGNYQIEVLQLAQAQRLTSREFQSDTESVGTGSMTFQFGEVDNSNNRFIPSKSAEAKTIVIGRENDSLRGVVEAINRANMPVRASLIHNGEGYRLVLSALETGETNTLRITTSEDTPNSGLSQFSYDSLARNGQGMNMIETSPAQNAVITIDGIEVSHGSNQIDSAIDGVTLDIKSLTSGQPIRVSTQYDRAAVVDAIKGFVNAYNEMNKSIQEIAGFNPQTKKGGPLSGDPTIRGINEQIRRIISHSFAGINEQYTSLSSIGLDTQRDGSLVLNDSKLQDALENAPQEVTNLFAKTGSASDSLIRFVGAGDQTQMGAHALRISQMPTHGYYIGDDAGSLTNTRIGNTDNKLVVKVDGITSSPVTLPAGIYSSASELAKTLEQQMNSDSVLQREKAEVKVRAVAGQLVIESVSTGKNSRVEIISADADIRDIGLDPAQGIEGNDIEATLGGQPADASGNRVTGRGNAEKLQIEVLGGDKGDRGEVFFSRGVAEQLYGALQGFLGNDGIISARNKGYDTRVRDIGKQREQMERHLASTEERLLNQFSNLDAVLGKMKQTSDFLASRLASLPGAGGSK